MERRHLNLLPDFCRNIITVAEERCGNEIEVTAYSQDTIQRCPAAVLAALPVASMSPTDARIEAPPSGIDRRALIHEVLHIHRNWLCPVPRAGVRDQSEIAGLVWMIENDIEHLAIVPMEITFAADARAYWERDLLQSVSTARGPYEAISLQRHWLLLRRFGITGLPQDACHLRLSQCGLVGAAEELVERIELANGDKLLQWRAVVRHFNISPEVLLFKTFLVGDTEEIFQPSLDWWFS